MELQRKRKRSLKAGLAEVRRQLKIARHEADAADKQWLLTGRALHVAMGIYLLSDCGLAPATMYLQSVGSSKGWCAKSTDDVHALIWNTFEKTDDKLLLSLLADGGDDALANARRDAQKHIILWMARVWNEDQNRQGKLPSRMEVFSHFEKLRMTIPADTRPKAYSSKSLAGLRKQASRICDRMAGILYKQPERDDVPAADLSTKALAAWQWHNHLCSRVQAGRKLVRINWDETAICLFPGTVKGNLVIRKEEFPAKAVPKAAKRTYYTHVALICDDASLQDLLPQVVIGNNYTLKAKDMAALLAACPKHVLLMRRDSSWVKGDVCAQIVRLIADALRKHLPTIQVILMFDVHSAHLNQLMWRACYNAGFWPMLIPALMTKYLQPLDTHVFAVYKLRLQRLYHGAGAAMPVTFSTLLDCIITAIRDVILSRDWSAAFASNGFSPGQGGVSAKKLAKLSINGPIGVSSARPTDEQLKACFPKNATVVSATVWRGVDTPRTPTLATSVMPKLIPLGTIPVVCPTAKPISSRTRAKSKTAIAHGSSSSKD